MKANPHEKPEKFVSYIIEHMAEDKGMSAFLRRADNPDTEYQSWGILAGFGIDLEKSRQRLPYATVAAAAAKAKIEKNGTAGIGRCIAGCYEDDSSSDQAKAKLRRLLACNSVEEACLVLRSLLSLISSKAKFSLDYSGLLEELLRFQWNARAVKIRWAKDFYGRADRNTAK